MSMVDENVFPKIFNFPLSALFLERAEVWAFRRIRSSEYYLKWQNPSLSNLIYMDI